MESELIIFHFNSLPLYTKIAGFSCEYFPSHNIFLSTPFTDFLPIQALETHKFHSQLQMHIRRFAIMALSRISPINSSSSVG